MNQIDLSLWPLHLIFIRLHALYNLGLAVRNFCIPRETAIAHLLQVIVNAVNVHLKILKLLVSLSLRCHESTVLYYYVYNIFQCQDTLVQFGSFLSMQLSTEEFVKRLPPIDKMVSEYHVPADAAFFLSRSLYSYEINVSIE